MWPSRQFFQDSSLIYDPKLAVFKENSPRFVLYQASRSGFKQKHVFVIICDWTALNTSGRRNYFKLAVVFSCCQRAAREVRCISWKSLRRTYSSWSLSWGNEITWNNYNYILNSEWLGRWFAFPSFGRWYFLKAINRTLSSFNLSIKLSTACTCKHSNMTKTWNVRPVLSVHPTNLHDVCQFCILFQCNMPW